MNPAALPTPEASSRRESRLLVLVFCAALLGHFYLATTNWTAGFLPGHEFRQSQTAIVSYYIAEQNNFSLRYETPILGKPWVALPLEVPLYEWSVVLLERATGLPDFEAARAVSLACFYLTLPALYLLLGQLGVSRARRLPALALILTCPIYIFYSRAFLMEPMVLMFSSWFLLSFIRTLRERKLSWAVLCTVSGAGSGLVKSTTFLSWLLPAAAYGAWCLWRDRRAGWKPALATIAWGMGSVMVPLGLVYWWIRFSDAIKSAHASAYIFTSKNLSVGNFGMFDLAARFSRQTWHDLLDCWQQTIMAPWLIGLFVVGGAVLFRTQRRWILGAAVLFLAPQCLFPFAYALQEYYFYACTVFLLGALGFVLLGVLDSPLPRWARWLVFLVPFAAQLANYWQGYHVIQSIPSPGGSGLTAALRDMTPKGSVLVIAGADWSAIIPYNSRRKALMIRRGMERDPAYLQRAFADLAGEDVSALILCDEERADTALLKLAAARFDLVTTPTFTHPTADVYVRKFYHQSITSRLKGKNNYDQIALPAVSLAVPATGSARQLIPAGMGATAFPMINPAPSATRFTFGYTAYPENNTLLLNAHPDSDLWLTPPADAAQIDWTYGIFPGAFEREGRKTDGVEFIIRGEQPDGASREIYRRLLDPANVPADRVRQQAVIPYRPLPGETLVFSTRPNHDNNFDWAYWARIVVK